MNADGFEIKKSGYHPQAGQAFSYQDGIRTVWFYTNLVEVDAGYDVVITDASSARFNGGPPQLTDDEWRVIEGNVRRYFRSVDYFDRSGPRSEVACDVKFYWRLDRR